MTEKPPEFTVTDRRKFTLEGALRDESSAAQEESTPTEAKPEAKAPNVVTMPAPKAEPEQKPAPEPVKAPEQPSATPETTSQNQEVPAISEQDEAAAKSAYQRSSDHIETMLRAANPAAGAPPAVAFEHVLQSIYLSAIVAMGAATEPGQKPQIDILGARQSIDMLGVLQEKTKGNLSEKEERLLQNALFESRMMFLEITNALAQAQAQRPPQGKK